MFIILVSSVMIASVLSQDIEGCTKMAGSGVCGECEAGRYLSQNMSECVLCSSGCKACSKNGECETCQTSYLFNTTTKKCDQCVNGCSLCADLLTCDTCSQYYFKNGTQCYSCPSGCLKCQSSDTCETCHENYVLNTDESNGKQSCDYKQISIWIYVIVVGGLCLVGALCGGGIFFCCGMRGYTRL